MTNRPPVDDRAQALRLGIARSNERLESALAQLGRVGAERFSVGGFVGKDPWPFVVGACLAGVVLGMRR